MTNVYVASAMPTGYPRKLQKPSTVSSRVRDTAESFILDSGIGDDVSNAEVLDLAHQYDADYVIAKDYLHDQGRTTASVRDFCDQYDAHPCTATPMVPLQPPHADHYADLPDHSYYVLGGMAGEGVSADEAARWTRDAAAVIPDDAHVHALGVGGGIRYTAQVAPLGILDSIDCSTPEQAAMFGSVVDGQLRQTEAMAFPGGDGKSRRTHPLAEFNAWQVQDVWDREASRSADITSW